MFDGVQKSLPIPKYFRRKKSAIREFFPTVFAVLTDAAMGDLLSDFSAAESEFSPVKLLPIRTKKPSDFEIFSPK